MVTKTSANTRISRTNLPAAKLDSMLNSTFLGEDSGYTAAGRLFGSLKTSDSVTFPFSDTGMGVVGLDKLQGAVPNDLTYRIPLSRPSTITMLAAGSGVFARRSAFTTDAVVEVITDLHSDFLNTVVPARDELASTIAKYIVAPRRDVFRNTVLTGGVAQMELMRQIISTIGMDDSNPKAYQLAQAILGLVKNVCNFPSMTDMFGVLETRAQGAITVDHWRVATMEANSRRLLNESLEASAKLNDRHLKDPKVSHSMILELLSRIIKQFGEGLKTARSTASYSLSLLAAVRADMLEFSSEIPPTMMDSINQLRAAVEEDLALQDIVLRYNGSITDMPTDSGMLHTAASNLLSGLESKRFSKVKLEDLANTLNVSVTREGLTKMPFAVGLHQASASFRSTEALDVVSSKDGSYTSFSKAALPSATTYDAFAAISSNLIGDPALQAVRAYGLSAGEDIAETNQIMLTTSLLDTHALVAMAFKQGGTRVLHIARDPESQRAFAISGQLFHEDSPTDGEATTYRSLLAWRYEPTQATRGPSDLVAVKTVSHPLMVIVDTVADEVSAVNKVDVASMAVEDLQKLDWLNGGNLSVLRTRDIPSTPVVVTINIGQDEHKLNFDKKLLLGPLDYSSTALVLPKALHHQVLQSLVLAQMANRSNNPHTKRLGLEFVSRQLQEALNSPLAQGSIQDVIWMASLAIRTGRLSDPRTQKRGVNAALTVMMTVMAATNYGTLVADSSSEEDVDVTWVQVLAPFMDALTKEIRFAMDAKGDL